MARKTNRHRRATVIVVPLDECKLTDEQLDKLLEILKVTTFSEETIDFRIQELDREDSNRNCL
jgi:hypothetical protein